MTRGSTLRGETGDYDVPHPHPYTHHYMTTTMTPQAMSVVGSRPGSAGGSGSGSSPGGCMSGGSGSGRGLDIGTNGHCGLIDRHDRAGSFLSTSGASIMGVGSRDGRDIMGVNYLECMHYERMPLPIPVPIPTVPPPQFHSEEEIEPAYSTGIKIYIHIP